MVGDGRLSLARVPDRHFDLLILDAYSSDAVPVHLITREALALYIEKLAEGGILLFHVSNRNVDLERVVANLVADAALTARIQHDDGDDADRYRYVSTWVAIARAPRDLAMLDGDARWELLRPDSDARPWTDDFSNIVGALKWGRLF